MERFGFIHEKLDIKILILYILRRLPGTVEPETLLELCQCDGGIGYFDYSDCLNELVETGHVEESEDGYRITGKGVRNADAVESSLPYSVRSKALKLIAPVEERLARAAMIIARHSDGDGGCIINVTSSGSLMPLPAAPLRKIRRCSDGKGEVLHLRFLCAGDEQAKLIEKNFRRGAEDYYQRIAALLSEQKEKKE